jgi:hypothetical protein
MCFTSVCVDWKALSPSYTQKTRRGCVGGEYFSKIRIKTRGCLKIVILRSEATKDLSFAAFPMLSERDSSLRSE